MHEHHGHPEGLAVDLKRIALLEQRRRILKLFGGAGLLLGGLACGVGGGSGTTPTGGSCSKIPEETGGPYPADGTNGVNALTQTGIVRSDIRTSFGSYSGTAPGVPLDITLSLVAANAACEPLVGYAVYLWHATQDGLYSLYTKQNENYLRGVQESDADGKVTFKTIFPGCYDGRWPHVHFEIFPTLQSATTATSKLSTSQLALPQDVCSEVYGASGYEASVSNLSRVSLDSDNVFRDGYSTQVATVTGAVASGLTASLLMGVNV
ncbi:MAG: dioxygenase [Myxococcaceae bacterium]|nr:dioxygenase [Myxococcaceae bacterium]